MNNARYQRRPSEAGFSLIELLVTIVIMAEILIGVAILFDSSSRVARSQTHLAELQQSLRVGQSEIVRYARMAGIGGLPVSRLNFDTGTEPDGTNTDYTLQGTFPRSGYAISLLNNVAADSDIISITHPSSSETPDGEVLVGSDVLILRGAFTTELFYVDPPIDIESWTAPDGDLANDPTVNQLVVVPERVRTVRDKWEDYPQDIRVLSERLEAARTASDTKHRPVALILRDTLNPNAYAIMEFDHENTTETMLKLANCPDLPPSAVNSWINDTFTLPQCIQFYVRLDPSTAPGNGYFDLSTGTSLETDSGGVTVDLDPTPTRQVEFPVSAGSIGLLEEHRIFLRREYEVPGVDTTRLVPVLSRASFLPGTDIQLDRVDIADNVIDLQIAVGVDSDAPGGTGYGVVLDNDSNSDEILFNDVNDTDGVGGGYAAPPGGALTWYDTNNLEYHFLRINTLVQSRFPDAKHLAPAIGNIEDYNRGATVTVGSTRYNDENRYHRRWLRTVVELRNLL